MCLHAEALRLRAQNVALRFSTSKDDQIRALSQAMTLAYLALASNEEWLAGTVHPYAMPEPSGAALILWRYGEHHSP